MPRKKNNPATPPSADAATVVPALLGWFQRHARDLPWRHTRDPYAIWISEIMLQQTQVKTVIPYWERWLRELPDVASLARAETDRVLKLWEGLGYYTRARNLQKAAQQIVAQYDGVFPRERADILALPGIGRYTVGAITSIAFNRPEPLLDGNVIRVLTRLHGISDNPKDKTVNERLWALSTKLVQHAATLSDPHDNNCSHLNQSLMELGATICLPRQPQCLLCPLQSSCVAFREQRQEQLPNLGPRTLTTARKFFAFVVEAKGRFLVRQRPEGVVNARLWEFPNMEVTEDNASVEEVATREFKVRDASLQPLTTIRHAITRYRITVEAYHLSLSIKPKTEGTWLAADELEALAWTSAHRKILHRWRAAKR